MTGLAGPGKGRKLLFVGITAVLAAAVLEGIGSLAYRFGLSESERQAIEATIRLNAGDRNDVVRFRPHPYLNYVANPDVILKDGVRPHHAIGIRDPGFDPTEKREGTLRVVALGGSTTYGLFTERGDQVWPSLVGLGLGQTLGGTVEVVNAGLPNYTTNEIIGMAALWLPEFQPDLVLVHTGLNDAFAAAYPEEGGPDARYFRHAWTHAELPGAVAAVLRVSRLARLVAAGPLRARGFMAGDMTASIQYALPPEDERRRNLDAATGRYYRRNLETIAVLVRRAGALPVFVEMPLNPAFETGDNPYFHAISQAVVRNNGIMREVGGRLELPVVPLYEEMRDPRAYIDAAHTNPRGMMQKAQAVYEALLPLASSRLEDSPTQSAASGATGP
jgi:lysophospholipase L1-like esterase